MYLLDDAPLGNGVPDTPDGGGRDEADGELYAEGHHPTNSELLIPLVGWRLWVSVPGFKCATRDCARKAAQHDPPCGPEQKAVEPRHQLSALEALERVHEQQSVVEV